jgi:hypothetical protein
MNCCRAVKLRKRVPFPANFPLTDLQVAVSGAFLAFIVPSPEDAATIVFSLITGRYLVRHPRAPASYCWCYDSDLYGTWVLSDDGLLLEPSTCPIPYWKIGISHPNPDATDTPKKFFMDHLCLFLMHFIGSEFDIPLSEEDIKCLQPAKVILDVLQEPDGRSIPGLHAFLAAFQVKLRRIKEPLGFDVRPTLLKIIENDELEEVRDHAAFVYVSNLSRWRETWSDLDSHLLTTILKRKVANWIVFDLLPSFMFPIEKMNIEVVQTITNFALEADEWWKPESRN